MVDGRNEGRYIGAEYFFDLIWDRNKTKEDFKSLMKELRISGAVAWAEAFKEDKKYREQGYPSQPEREYKKELKGMKFWRNYINEIEEIKSEIYHIKFIKSIKGIGSNGDWLKYYENNPKLKRLGYLKQPWAYFSVEYCKWQDDIWGVKNDRDISKEELKKLWLKHKITSSNWHKIRKENNWQELYKSDPWDCLGFTCKTWSNYVYDKKAFIPKSKKEHQEKFKILKCETVKRWMELWKELCLMNDGYYKEPWKTYGGTQQEWKEEIIGKKIMKTKEEHKKYSIKHHITTSENWIVFYKRKNRYKFTYYKIPWAAFGMTQKEWTSYINEK